MIYLKPDKATFKRERRKLKAFKAKNIPVESVKMQYDSWRGALLKRFGYVKSLESTDKLYNVLFGGDYGRR